MQLAQNRCLLVIFFRFALFSIAEYNSRLQNYDYYELATGAIFSMFHMFVWNLIAFFHARCINGSHFNGSIEIIKLHSRSFFLCSFLTKRGWNYNFVIAPSAVCAVCFYILWPYPIPLLKGSFYLLLSCYAMRCALLSFTCEIDTNRFCLLVLRCCCCYS